MSIDLDAGEDGLIITNVAMFEKSVATQKGSEGDWARRERYLGPRAFLFFKFSVAGAIKVVAEAGEAFGHVHYNEFRRTSMYEGEILVYST